MALDYVPNPNRCIHLSGEIDEGLVERLLPRITELRSESAEVITVYIDSVGGEIYYADLLRELLTQPDLHGRKCSLITVTYHRAMSAAAMFLARGHYAIAFPSADIHCHGFSLQVRKVTTESASQLSGRLQENNQKYALDLATSVIQRVFWLSVLHDTHLPPVYTPEFVPEFAKFISDKLLDGGKRLVDRALKKQQEMGQLQTYILQKWRMRKKHELHKSFQVSILKVILDYEEKRKPKDWLLSNEGLQDIRNDFLQFSDFFWGDHKKTATGHVRGFFCNLLPEPDRKKLAAFSENESAQKEKWLAEHVDPKLSPVWYFVLTLCRLLFEGENPFDAQEAYWLGLVDEVGGDGLSSQRQFIAGLEIEKTKMATSTIKLGSLSVPPPPPPPSHK